MTGERPSCSAFAGLPRAAAALWRRTSGSPPTRRPGAPPAWAWSAAGALLLAALAPLEGLPGAGLRAASLLGLLALLPRLLRAGARTAPSLAPLERVALGREAGVALVDAGGRRLLLGWGRGGVRLLAELPRPGLEVRATEPRPLAIVAAAEPPGPPSAGGRWW